MEEFKIGDWAVYNEPNRAITMFKIKDAKSLTLFNYDGYGFDKAYCSLATESQLKEANVKETLTQTHCEKFKIGDTVTTYKQGSQCDFYPEKGVLFKVFDIEVVSDGILLITDNKTAIDADRCKLVHREEDKDQLRPDHYGGKDNPYECIKVIRAWNLGFELGNVLKYINRTGKKDNAIQDLEKAKTYLEMEIEKLKNL